MALRDLNSSEMLYLTGPWLQAGSLERTTIQRFPVLDGMVPKIERAHRALDEASRPERNGNSRLGELGAQLQEVEARHDRAARGAWGFVNGANGLLDPETASELGEIKDFLFPNGLARATTRSFRAKAGDAEQVALRLTAERRAMLARYRVAGETRPAPGGAPSPSISLLELVERWIAAGLELGDLERERDRVASETARLQGENEQKARNQWIRTINALRVATELEEVEGRDRDVLVGPLDGVLALADRRRQRRREARATPPRTPALGAPGAGSGASGSGSGGGASVARPAPVSGGGTLPVVALPLPAPTPTAPAGGARAP